MKTAILMMMTTIPATPLLRVLVLAILVVAMPVVALEQAVEEAVAVGPVAAVR